MKLSVVGGQLSAGRNKSVGPNIRNLTYLKATSHPDRRTIFSVMVEYPNWFANVPSSLEAKRNFYKVLYPRYFFQIRTALSFLADGFSIAALFIFFIDTYDQAT
ncbi:MAG: hypothetical protein ABI857_00805 [Acidobacteriota bacterium]